jgi:hypothetical protein
LLQAEKQAERFGDVLTYRSADGIAPVVRGPPEGFSKHLPLERTSGVRNLPPVHGWLACSPTLPTARGREGIVHPDPSAQSRKTSAAIGETDLTIIERAGWSVYRSSPYKLVDRINSVNAMLLNAQGQRRLLVSPRCKHLIKALDCLTYKEGSKIPDNRSGLDHITDAIGYLTMGVFPITPRNTVSIHQVLL